MALRARVRGRNLARIGGVAAAVVAAATFGPTLLRPPRPEPLPPDLGLPRALAGGPARAPAGPACRPDRVGGAAGMPARVRLGMPAMRAAQRRRTALAAALAVAAGAALWPA